MPLDKSSTRSTNRGADTVICSLLLALLVLAWGASADGPAFRFNEGYWRSVAPVAIPAAILVAWGLQKALVGTWYKPRYARYEQQMQPGESWAAGAIAAAILVGVASMAYANLMNEATGTEYVAIYSVAEKYVTSGKRTCYGLRLSKQDDPKDQFPVCLPQRDQEKTPLGERFQVTGRRSKYANQMLSYASIRQVETASNPQTTR
ncbi:hypothetical protein Bsp3421_004638 [Burkholderia sp. FERM BP-3421]|uniref:hypothetical protein n=1 Tax=Burkholderia sp. FERM BP-3421 TaxID=1494466 RepID=UPI00236264DD|nr:hypothetical protein [Burkholderia sp. FERM BP-3421]WDD94510.1 hypothetical protein Bsp3421_004638 [Burkholderia sp. FERM BP-3421]